MKLLQRLNPFYWRNKYLALSKDHNLLKELKRKSDDVAWNYRIQVEDLKRKNEELLAQALQLQEELDDWENVAKNLQRQLNKAEERHQQWFKLVLDFTSDDFILLNKSLWGQKIALVPEPCGLKDEKTNNDNA